MIKFFYHLAGVKMCFCKSAGYVVIDRYSLPRLWPLQYLWQQIYGLIMHCVNNVLLQSAVSVHLRAHFCRYHSEGLINSLKLSFCEVHQLIFLLVNYWSAGDDLILWSSSVLLYLNTSNQNDTCNCGWKHTINLKDCMILTLFYFPHLNQLKIIILYNPF